ncbi:response regulator transcription factor [Schaalia sp. HMT-877]|nr:response regulator receiver domain protein [Actinomyces sp. oral taxon 877 str. F0543]WLD79603.1 response regulator transcription factor [Schaalia sp. HMT-877]
MRVLIVDDDAIVVQSLATILSAEDGIDVVGTCLSGAEAVQEFRRLRPDVLLMDIRMPGADGLSAAEEILEGDPQARIVFLTTFSDDEYIVRALRMGARGYLIKQDVAQIAPALRSVMVGVCVLEGDVLERGASMGMRALPAPVSGSGAGTSGSAVGEPGGRMGMTRGRVGGTSGRAGSCGAPGRPTGAVGAPDPRSTVFASLTDREYEVVEAVAAGLDNAETAERLFMSEGTVRNHISSILAKTGLRNRTQVAVRYYRAGR